MNAFRHCYPFAHADGGNLAWGSSWSPMFFLSLFASMPVAQPLKANLIVKGADNEAENIPSDEMHSQGNFRMSSRAGREQF